MGIQALARAVERDVRRVHDDTPALLDVGLVEKDDKVILGAARPFSLYRWSGLVFVMVWADYAETGKQRRACLRSAFYFAIMDI